MDKLPVELWILILSFLKANEEFPVASVCKMFYDILAEKRAKRGDTDWQTSLAPFCRTPKQISWIREKTCALHTWPAVKQMIPFVLVRQKNYNTLIDFLCCSEYNEGLYEALMGQGAFDVVRTLLKNYKIKPPYDGIKLAIKSGQLDLVKTLHDANPGIWLDMNQLKDAIHTTNFDIVKVVFEMIKKKYNRFWIPISSCIDTGNVDIVKFAFDNFNLPTPGVVEQIALVRNAFRQDNIKLLKYLLFEKLFCIDNYTLWDLRSKDSELAAQIPRKHIVHQDWSDPTDTTWDDYLEHTEHYDFDL